MTHLGAPIPECFSTPDNNCQPVQIVVLCDQYPPSGAGDGALVPFLRRYIVDCSSGAIVGFVDTDFDGNPYVVVGTVQNCDSGNCPDCTFDAFRQHREELVGVGAWLRPAGASSVTVKCRAVGNALTPPTITDANGVVTALFVGDEETWASPDGTPLSDGFTVTGNDAGDIITIIWLETI